MVSASKAMVVDSKATMLCLVIIQGVQGRILELMSTKSIEQAEATCKAFREASQQGNCWTRCALRELHPSVVVDLSSAEAGLRRNEIRHIVAALSVRNVTVAIQPLRFSSLQDAKIFAEMVARNRRRGDHLSASGAPALLVVCTFRFRPLPEQIRSEDALISEELAVVVCRRGREEVLEIQLTLPRAGGVIFRGRVQEAVTEGAASAQIPAASELYADIFSVGGGHRHSLRLLDALLRADGECVHPGFSAVSGAWGPGADRERFAAGLTALVCLREVAASTSRPAPLTHVPALGLERVRSRA